MQKRGSSTLKFLSSKGAVVTQGLSRSALELEDVKKRQVGLRMMLEVLLGQWVTVCVSVISIACPRHEYIVKKKRDSSRS